MVQEILEQLEVHVTLETLVLLDLLIHEFDLHVQITQQDLITEANHLPQIEEHIHLEAEDHLLAEVDLLEVVEEVAEAKIIY